MHRSNRTIRNTSQSKAPSKPIYSKSSLKASLETSRSFSKTSMSTTKTSRGPTKTPRGPTKTPRGPTKTPRSSLKKKYTAKDNIYEEGKSKNTGSYAHWVRRRMYV